MIPGGTNILRAGMPQSNVMPVDFTPGVLSPDFQQHIPGIFAGESGGDYDALFGFSNRPGGPFEDVRLTDMTVGEAAAFSDPSGPYAQWVKDQIGHVATPMGAYQVVGTTLRAAMDGLGLTGNEPMTPEVQDQIGQWIYENQGIGAWEGYRPGVTEMPVPSGGNYRGSATPGGVSGNGSPMAQMGGQPMQSGGGAAPLVDPVQMAFMSMREAFRRNREAVSAPFNALRGSR